MSVSEETIESILAAARGGRQALEPLKELRDALRNAKTEVIRSLESVVADEETENRRLAQLPL